MTQNYSTRQMLRVRNWVTVVLFLLAFGGRAWREQPSGRVTHMVMMIADTICPPLAYRDGAPITIAGGAHAPDMAVFDRLLGDAANTAQCRRLPKPGEPL